jgi:hypothetical protein
MMKIKPKKTENTKSIQGVKLERSIAGDAAVGALSGVGAVLVLAVTAVSFVAVVPSVVLVGAGSLMGGSFGFSLGRDGQF